MIPATEPRPIRESSRLLVVDSTRGSFRDARMTDLPDLLRSGDLLVVNDAATLPASLTARTSAAEPIEIRLVKQANRSAADSDWDAILLGAGDWRIPTELRDPPGKVSPGDTLHIGGDFAATIVAVSEQSDRLVTLRFNRSVPEMWNGIYAYGRPVQYSYIKDDLALWSVQTVYGSRPWAMEMPSAGQPLSWSILLALKRRDIRLTWLTHAAGLSAVGHEELDDQFPMTESFDIPEVAIEAIEQTQAHGGRIIASGTTVVRALEGCAALNGGKLAPGRGETDLIIDRSFEPIIVDGILTGVHDPAQSHFRLLHAFSDETTLRRAWRHATAAGYLCHEFGDSCLVL
jgi:S-adenosylmethionine:tRNA ribosyltransferase-isomerase